MKEYELVVLYHPDLESDIDKATAKVADIIKDAKGRIVGEDDWGRRKLAYTIKKEDYALYRVYDLELPAEAPQKINDVLNITGEVLRFLLTKVDLKVRALIEEDKNREETDEENKEENSEEE